MCDAHFHQTTEITKKTLFTGFLVASGIFSGIISALILHNEISWSSYTTVFLFVQMLASFIGAAYNLIQRLVQWKKHHNDYAFEFKVREYDVSLFNLIAVTFLTAGAWTAWCLMPSDLGYASATLVLAKTIQYSIELPLFVYDFYRSYDILHLSGGSHAAPASSV